MAEEKSKERSEVETQLLEKVSATISAVNSAKCVDDVILSLHSLARLLFPINTCSFSGEISEQYRDQLAKEETIAENEGRQLWDVFYRGLSFPTIARFLVHDIACNWLSCFPVTARKLVYDVFFEKGLIIEVVQALVPSLDHKDKAVRSNAERLIVICLLENEGVVQLTRELNIYHESKGSSSSLIKVTISRVGQLIASVPDKVRRGAPKPLSSHSFFKSIIIQLLAGAQEKSSVVCGEYSISSSSDVDVTLTFIAEVFSRICRRGSTDLLLYELIPQILKRLRSFISSHTVTNLEDDLKSDPSFQFWFLMMEIIKDAYVLERMAEQILHHLATECVKDTEAYWTLWVLFHRSFLHQLTVRFMFVEKFLLSKVFPLCCLRWILQFAIFGCPFDSGKMNKCEKNHVLLESVQRVVMVWCKRGFVQSAPLEQQVYVTAATGLMLENMSKEDLDATKDVMRAILEGVSCRLENPDDLVRKMASSIALVFSKVIDPKNPLYLDDSYTEGNVDWEFGVDSMNKIPSTREIVEPSNDLEQTNFDINKRGSKLKPKKKKNSAVKLVDPDEVVDPATLNDELLFTEDEDDNLSEGSETSSDSSLPPYDLTDDDTDLKKKISQLVDVVGALRKTDDPDGVDQALDVAEKFVRAFPDELAHVAGDLVRTLIQVRCADTAVEGEEDSAEEKRQKALIALLVICPFESLDSINKLLFSPNLDVSQRIMILDVMTDAAQELANTKTVVQRKLSGSLISGTGEPQPWFLPSNKGPSGASSWKELPDTVSPLNYTYRFERELPSKTGELKRGKTRRWGHRPVNLQATTELDRSLNKFPLYAAAFMLPAMRGFDRKRHGVDLLGRDFIVLGKLIYMLGVCIRCAALHPEAFTLAPPLLDMLSSREVCHHKEAYVRRSALFAASCTLTALHPSFIASALLEGNEEVSRGLEWVRTWALQIAESDTDRECSTMAMSCLQLHANMSLQASRAMESNENTKLEKNIGLPSNLSKGQIKIPGLNSLSLKF